MRRIRGVVARLLPYGRLRESTEGMSRADCVVITRCDQVESVDALREEISRLDGWQTDFRVTDADGACIAVEEWWRDACAAGARRGVLRGW